MKHKTGYLLAVTIFAAMKLNTVIFDMDGLLIDSEPLWQKAAEEYFLTIGKTLNARQYAETTGLRTKEFLAHWFSYFGLTEGIPEDAEKNIVNRVIQLVQKQPRPMPGVAYILDFFQQRGFKTGLASSSPPELINVVADILDIKQYIGHISSAANLKFGKPHPEVYLNCAEALNAVPEQCICFEDSFNGIIAAKAAKMKCVVVPAAFNNKSLKWEAADLKISTLNNFNELLLNNLH